MSAKDTLTSAASMAEEAIVCWRGVNAGLEMDIMEGVTGASENCKRFVV